MRLKQFLKGVFLYNTIYWRRASDDLDIKRMSREERANLRPKRNLGIIRPREQPRPAGEISLPPVGAESARVAMRNAGDLAPHATAQAETSAEAENELGEQVEIRRRKKRRSSRHSRVMPKKYYSAGADGGGGGILGWLFRK